MKKIDLGDTVRLAVECRTATVIGTMTLQDSKSGSDVVRSVCLFWPDGMPAWHRVEAVVLVAKAKK
jgi:hypothetical protein